MKSSQPNINNKQWRKTGKWVLCLVLLFIVTSFFSDAQNNVTPPAEIKPTIPTTDRYIGKRVFLEHADILKKETSDSFQILVGNVLFRRQDMYMSCDSAHFYDKSGSFQAFGNVKMEQGDTLFVYADELDYDGLMEIATLYADANKKVRLINRDVTLETDKFEYDLTIDLGYYDVGGVLTDARNRLESIEGEYSPATKEANFYRQVHLTGKSERDTLNIFTDSLFYNTTTHIASLSSKSEISNINATMFTEGGTYDTDADTAFFDTRSLIVAKNGNTLWGDTIRYNHRTGIGEAFGNMILTDSTRHISLNGDYGYYHQLIDSAYATGHALVKEFSGNDTLYLHAKVIRSFVITDSIVPDSGIVTIDTTHIIIANPRVRFYRADLQGICDSLSFQERDSMLYMHHNPIVWSGSRQIFGNIIQVHFNDSTADWAQLPEFGFVAEHIDEEFYNQLSGKKLYATFANNSIKHLDVEGNVQAIVLPQESDSTYNKIFSIESSFLEADFNKNTIERLKCWPDNNTVGTPLYLAKKSIYYLPKFRWFDVLRPRNAADVFIFPPEMDGLSIE